MVSKKDEYLGPGHLALLSYKVFTQIGFQEGSRSELKTRELLTCVFSQYVASEACFFNNKNYSPQTYEWPLDLKVVETASFLWKNSFWQISCPFYSCQCSSITDIQNNASFDKPLKVGRYTWIARIVWLGCVHWDHEQLLPISLDYR